MGIALARLLLLGALALPAAANEIWLYAGTGPQPGADQNNHMVGIDWLAWDYQRSPKQVFSLGFSYSHLRASGDNLDGYNRQLEAFSIVPQLTLLAEPWRNMLPLFQVRALGPTYLSEKRLGLRQQGMHFALQAQISAGLRFGQGYRHQLNIIYRHYSNANLDDLNDGFDIPVVLGYRYQF